MMSEQVSEPYFRFGEGKISGWISVTLGGLSVLGVLCFHFPDFLTTPQLRQAYTVDQMRWLLLGGMIFSAAFGLVTFVLNRHKLMGAIGITLTLLALWGGGASAQVGPRYARPAISGSTGSSSICSARSVPTSRTRSNSAASRWC